MILRCVEIVEDLFFKFERVLYSHDKLTALREMITFHSLSSFVAINLISKNKSG